MNNELNPIPLSPDAVCTGKPTPEESRGCANVPDPVPVSVIGASTREAVSKVDPYPEWPPRLPIIGFPPRAYLAIANRNR